MVINSLWIGQCPLRLQQKLTIKSFIKNGYKFRVWSYNPKLVLPIKAELADASLIVPENEIYQLKNFGGSYVFFADYFQCCFLYSHGGIWSHLDVTCLKSLPEYNQEYLFVPHWKTKIGSYAMKAPQHSEFALNLKTEHKRLFNKDTVDWHSSMELMSNMVYKFKLENYIVDKAKVTIDYPVNNSWEQMYQEDQENLHLIHWCDFATIQISNNYSSNNFYSRLLNKYVMPSHK